MRSTEPDAHSVESLRRENEELRRQLLAARSSETTQATLGTRPGWRPSGITIAASMKAFATSASLRASSTPWTLTAQM